MKICSLLPSGTEILFAIGLGDQVTGVTDLCDYPPEARDKRIVCRSKIDVLALSSDQVEEMMHQILASGESPYELDQGWLEQHPPDVVLTQDLCYFCEIDAPTVNQALKSIPVPPDVLVLQPKTLEEIFDSIRQVGQTCGAAEPAANLVAELQSRVEAIRKSLAHVAQRPRVFSLEGINPLVIGGHWIPDLLEIAGGRQSLYPAGCPATRLEWREILDYAPEKLFIDLCSSDLNRHLSEIPWLANQEGWQELPAVKVGRGLLDRPRLFQLSRTARRPGVGDSSPAHSSGAILRAGAARHRAETRPGQGLARRPAGCGQLLPSLLAAISKQPMSFPVFMLRRSATYR